VAAKSPVMAATQPIVRTTGQYLQFFRFFELDI
jgi:hypothetical protein